MGDMGEGWDAWREMKQTKRRSNLAYSTGKLVREGLTFTAHNNGIHLVLTKDDKTIDYWPSTGLWWIRGTRNKRRGIDKLIAYIKGKTHDRHSTVHGE